VVYFLLRTETELILKSRRVVRRASCSSAASRSRSHLARGRAGSLRALGTRRSSSAARRPAWALRRLP